MEVVGEIPRHSFLDPRLYSNITSAPSSSLSSKIDDEKDQQFIHNWLAEKGKFQVNPNFFSTRKSHNEFGINVAKRTLKSCLAIIENLNKTQEELRNNVETMDTAEWKQKTQEIGTLKDEFAKYIQPFEDGKILSSLKGALKVRARKRLNQKRRKKMRQQLLKEKLEQQKEQHKVIDRWLESKKEEVERAKMEDKMKKDADCVLYEVTKKKSEARKQLSLISALVKLRTVRDSMATQRGEKLSLEDRKAFGAVTEKLIRMWENSCQNYCKEEQCLKVMLEHNASDTKSVKVTKQSKVIEQWDSLIFGLKDSTVVNNPTFWALTSADRDLETFIAIRKSWDTFVKVGGTAIPLGWVIPPNQPNPAWGAYLKTD